MYSWTDQGNNNLTLKPELTAPVVRSFIQHKLGRLQPINRLYYIDALFRRERPQKGRQRQFHQFGVEAFGSEHPEMDVEVISIAYHIYKSFGITELSVKINSIGSPEVRPKYFAPLRNLREVRSLNPTVAWRRLWPQQLVFLAGFEAARQGPLRTGRSL